MGFKLKPKHLVGAYKIACKAAPIVIEVAEIALPQTKAVKAVVKPAKAILKVLT
jgi:hypothetical protein